VSQRNALISDQMIVLLGSPLISRISWIFVIQLIARFVAKSFPSCFNELPTGPVNRCNIGLFGCNIPGGIGPSRSINPRTRASHRSELAIQAKPFGRAAADEDLGK